LLAAMVFGAGLLARRRAPTGVRPGIGAWLAIAVNAAVAGLLAGWTVENVWIESLGVGGWLRSLAFAGLAIAAPVAGAAALARPIGAPAFAQVIGPRADRVHDRLSLALGLLLLALTVLAMQAALALAFDPRYRDFPFAPLTAAALPFALLRLVAPRPAGQWPIAETAAAAVLALSAIFIVWHETLANWQALWFGGALGLLAISLVRARAAPG
jgi:hypothetical protein